MSVLQWVQDQLYDNKNISMMDTFEGMLPDVVPTIGVTPDGTIVSATPGAIEAAERGVDVQYVIESDPRIIEAQAAAKPRMKPWVYVAIGFAIYFFLRSSKAGRKLLR